MVPTEEVAPVSQMPEAIVPVMFAMSDLLRGYCDGCAGGSTLLVCQFGLAASPGFPVCVSVSGKEVDTYMLSMRYKQGPIV